MISKNLTTFAVKQRLRLLPLLGQEVRRPGGLLPSADTINSGHYTMQSSL